MRIKVNGELRDVTAELTVGQLLTQLQVPGVGTAVEVNGTILTKEEKLGRQLVEGDALEIVRLIGGG